MESDTSRSSCGPGVRKAIHFDFVQPNKFVRATEQIRIAIFFNSTRKFVRLHDWFRDNLASVEVRRRANSGVARIPASGEVQRRAKLTSGEFDVGRSSASGEVQRRANLTSGEV